MSNTAIAFLVLLVVFQMGFSSILETKYPIASGLTTVKNTSEQEQKTGSFRDSAAGTFPGSSALRWSTDPSQCEHYGYQCYLAYEKRSRSKAHAPCNHCWHSCNAKRDYARRDYCTWACRQLSCNK